MKVVLLLLGLAVCVSAVDAKRRSPRDLSVEWLWAKDGTAPEQENEVGVQPRACSGVATRLYQQLAFRIDVSLFTFVDSV